jgi:hypothetical protein
MAAATSAKPYTIGNQVVTGFAVRYQDNLNYDDYNHEPASAWDLSRPRSEINFSSANKYGDFLFPSFHIPGLPSNYTFNAANGDSAQSTEIVLSPFYQHKADLTDKLSVLAGWRVDALFEQANNPPGTPATFTYDVTPAFTQIPRVSRELNTNQVQLNGNIGPTYKLFPWMTAYADFNYSESRKTGNGGSIDPYSTTKDFHQESFLYEAGFKFSLLKDTLFLTVTGYNQNLTVPTLGGPGTKAETNGFEFEAKYQPNRNFYGSIGYSFIDAYLADDFMIQEYAINAGNAPGAGTGVITTGTFNTTGVGPNPPRANPNASNRQKMLGLPEHSFNGLLNYKFDFGLGATFGATFNSDQDLNYLRTVSIPFQYSIDASVYYTQPHYEVRVALLNLTDEKNWSPAGSGFQTGRLYNLDGIVPEQPFRVEATVKYKF